MSKQTRKKSAKASAVKTSRAKPTGTATKSAVKASAKPATKPAHATTAGAAAKTIAPSAATLVEGARAPSFKLPRDGGETVALSDYSGKKLAIFFYPRANTPGCTREAIDFTRLAAEFAASGTSVIGVSADSVKAQDSFRDKHQLGIPLLSDSTHAMLEAYGAWGEKSLYGRKFEGIIRTTVLVGRDGKVARIWRNVKVDGHADQVLATAKTL